MGEFQNVADLVDEIQKRTAGLECPLVGLDGAYGSGKSTLAKAVAEKLDGIVLEVDRYTERNGKPYREQLRYEDLRRDLKTTRSDGKPVIVDGVCLLDVMDAVGAKVDALVYVKKVDRGSGIWQDQDTCDPEWIDLEHPLLKHPGAALAREVAAYHQSRDPLSQTELVFIRTVEG